MEPIEVKCRIGKLTGKIYPEGTDLSTIGECCVIVKWKSAQELEEEVNKVKARSFIDCTECRGCPEYRRLLLR